MSDVYVPEMVPMVVQRGSVLRDIIARAQEIEATDWVLEHAPERIVRHLENAKRKPWIQAMSDDARFFSDLRQPVLMADNATITLTSTAADLFDVARFASFPANYWTPGKTLKLTAFGKITTAVTPGNAVWSLATANAVNTGLVSTVATALIASKTNLSVKYEGWYTCRSTGSGGTMQLHGEVKPHVGLVLSTAQPCLIPDSAPTTVAQDTTATTAVRLEMSRSGSTVETAAITALYIEIKD